MDNMRVWLSGGAGGLGVRLAEAMIANGCTRVALVDIAPESKGQEVIQHLKQTYNTTVRREVHELKLLYYSVDVRNSRAVEHSMRDAVTKLGGLTAVINNAGVMDESDLERAMGVNAIAVIRATELALRILSKGGGNFRGTEERRLGHMHTVVNIASAAGVFALPGAAYYSASKHAVVGYCRSIAEEALTDGVRVVCVCPAWVDVGMGEVALQAGVVQRSPAGVMKVEVFTKFLMDVLRSEEVSGGDVFYVSDQVGVTRAHAKLRKTPLFASKL